MDKAFFQNYLTLAETATKTGIEYHTLLAKFKRDGNNNYKAFNTKWGWMVSPECVQKLIEEQS